MNTAAFVLALVGVALNFFMPMSGNLGTNFGFGMFLMHYIEAKVGFVIFGIFSIVYLITQIMALFKGYHALKRRRDKNVVGFFKFVAIICAIYAAIMYFAYSSYMDFVRNTGFYGFSDINIAPYIPILLQVLCFAFASSFAHNDEKEDEIHNISQTPSNTQENLTQDLTATKEEKTFEPVLGIETEALIKRAFIFISDNDFDEAERYFEQALRQDPENSQAYLGKLMAELKVHNTDELSKISKSLKDEKLFQRALSFANDEDKILLENCLEVQNKAIKALQEQKKAEIEQKYIKALEDKEKISSSSDAQNIIMVLKSIAPYKDSEVIIQELEQKKENFEVLERNYMTGKWLMIFIIMAIIGAGAFYVYTQIEQNAAKRAEEARIEAEKQEEKSRIEALKLQFQEQN